MDNDQYPQYSTFASVHVMINQVVVVGTYQVFVQNLWVCIRSYTEVMYTQIKEKFQKGYTI